MIYNVRTQDEWDRAQAYSKGGHTDFGSLTLLFSQHVAGLQIRTPEGEWKYVKPVDGGITCNAADTLSFLTKGEWLTTSAPGNRFENPANLFSPRLYQIDRPPRGNSTKRPAQHPPSRSAVFQSTGRQHADESSAVTVT
jgi:hypothetical protein